jgi:2-polyprenyl-6-methoxyphenol hydroxylase-like FAD-dependent oxidoreductase
VVGRTIEVEAAFVVGADGHHSMVRQALGIENERLAAAEHYVVYEFEPEAELADELGVVLTESSKSVLWPLPDHRCRWSFQLAGWEETEFAEKDREPFWGESPAVAQRTQQRLQQQLAARAPWFGTGIRALDWAADIQFQHRLARQYGRGRCWLVGDAAHQTAPAGIQSMNVGLLEAEDLAAKLAQIIREAAPEAILAEYERAHRDEWRRLLGATGAPKAGAATSPWIERHSRQILSSLPASGNELGLLLTQLGLGLP